MRREGDLAEEYPDLYVPTAEELAEVELYTNETVDAQKKSVSELEEVAAEMADGSD